MGKGKENRKKKAHREQGGSYPASIDGTDTKKDPGES